MQRLVLESLSQRLLNSPLLDGGVRGCLAGLWAMGVLFGAQTHLSVDGVLW